MNVVLTDHLAGVVQAALDSGRYNDQSEVVRDAIRHLEADKTSRQPTCAELARALRDNQLPQDEARAFGQDIQNYLAEIRQRSRNGDAR